MNLMIKWLMAVVVAVGMVSQAQAADVKYDYDKTADVSDWQGWSWKTPARAGQIGFEEARVREALAAGFAAKGYREVEPDAADFRVEYHGVARPQVRFSDTWSPGFGRNLRVDKQMVGTLVVEAYDARTGRLVWRGAISDVLASDPGKADEKVAKAVTKLLKKFPAPGGA